MSKSNKDEDNGRTIKPQNKPGKDGRRGRHSKKTKNQVKRYQYVRCQEIFKECSRKLADVIVNNVAVYLEPAKQPHEAREVKSIYKDLWATDDPLNPLILENRTSRLLIHEIFR